MTPHDPGTLPLAIAVTGFVVMISLMVWSFYDSRRSYRALQHAILHGQIELQRGQTELQRGQTELKRLDIVIGGLVYQEDEKIRALITARFDELLRLLPR
jgi:hypothetical protein